MKIGDVFKPPEAPPPKLGDWILSPMKLGRRELGVVAQVLRRIGAGRWLVRSDDGIWYDVRKSETDDDSWVFTARHLLTRFQSDEIHFPKGRMR